MDYLFENLGDERFQELCQALLVKEFPNVQCFPVGQPDGGRDALRYMRHGKQGTEFCVYQVKFNKAPYSGAEPWKWLEGVLKKEAPKLASLIPKGAKAYYLITNVPGSAHLETGAIDKCNEILRAHISIPSQCWWRNDLNRRLDSSYDLKWAYPELLSGHDMLRMIVESGLSEHRERRATALRAFVGSQYHDDTDVRFKQVELKNRLVDLFIDVPMALRGGYRADKPVPKWFYRSIGRTRRGEDSDQRGAAAALLDPAVQGIMPRIVLEGAPGQGKSTLAQYLCQVHRMCVLGEMESLDALPAEHRPVSVRLPFRVELRDFATWLERKDPFSADESARVPEGWSDSLEAFLAAQVRQHSGGTAFSVDDLLAVVKLSAVLLVLDGLDEVAEVERRKTVVAAATAAINRLDDLSASLQVVITSRPSVFAAGVGFDEQEFPHFQLLSLPKSLIADYAERWLRVRSLGAKDIASFRRVLAAKIEQPHIRDLARNPMQLAILLSLIHTLGPSLPDKRTALYDEYVKLFLNREAEKSTIVSENRELLINVHRYLAWMLHSHAEKGEHRGIVSRQRLEDMLSEYLVEEGRASSSVRDLFTGMVERIVFLVSRVEGSYEFEVQPLREYFAARHLYETAPYSPPGKERSGTKPDRFDAIAGNPYWLNVARFYAGCFSKGELASLSHSLQELASKNGACYAGSARLLAVLLLSDYVFSQDQRVTTNVTTLALSGPGLGHLLGRDGLAPTSPFGPSDPVSLPEDCGRGQLVEGCIDILRTAVQTDVLAEAATLLSANCSPSEVDNLWMETLWRESDVCGWLMIGLYLGALERAPRARIGQWLNLSDLRADEMGMLLSLRSDLIMDTESNLRTAMGAIADSGSGVFHPGDTVLSRIASAFCVHRYLLAFHSPQPRPLREVLAREWGLNLPLEAESDGEERGSWDRWLGALRRAESELDRNVSEWVSEIAPWDITVEALRGICGDGPAVFALAAIGAGIRSAKDTCTGSTSLVDHSASLCQRARYARLRAGNAAWWLRQFEAVDDQSDACLVALISSLWASTNVLVTLSEAWERVLFLLTPKRREWIVEVIRDMRRWRNNSVQVQKSHEIPDSLSDSAIAILGTRLPQPDMTRFYRDRLGQYDGSDACVVSFCSAESVGVAMVDASHWPQALRMIERQYSLGGEQGSLLLREQLGSGIYTLPIGIARQIVETPVRYPQVLVYAAEEQCRRAGPITAVWDVAEVEHWFASEV